MSFRDKGFPSAEEHGEDPQLVIRVTVVLGVYLKLSEEYYDFLKKPKECYMNDHYLPEGNLTIHISLLCNYLAVKLSAHSVPL